MSAGFRALKSAAPLKRQSPRRRSGPFRGFRALKSAAPLKPAAHTSSCRRPRWFPRPQKRGPVEA